MITDSQLYSLAIFLGSLAMLLIVLYHFLEVNAKDDHTNESQILVQKGGQQQAKGDKGQEKPVKAEALGRHALEKGKVVR